MTTTQCDFHPGLLQLPEARLLECLVTTRNEDDTCNLSPMGPIVDANFEWLRLRPFQTSTTYRNLKRAGEGVLHITDDVELIAQSAIGEPRQPPRLCAASAVEADIVADACRWYAFRVVTLDDSQPRTEIVGQVVDSGRIRDFCGFNRAKHAVLEAAILATRIHLIPDEKLLSDLDRLRELVDKTGAHAEHRAFRMRTVVGTE